MVKLRNQKFYKDYKIYVSIPVNFLEPLTAGVDYYAHHFEMQCNLIGPDRFTVVVKITDALNERIGYFTININRTTKSFTVMETNEGEYNRYMSGQV